MDDASRLTRLRHDGRSSTGIITLLAEYRGSSTANSPIVYDANGRIKNVYVQAPSPSGGPSTGEGQYLYTYDSNGQLTNADLPADADVAHSYDLEGNRTNAGYATALDNRMTSGAGATYAHDGEGNQTSRSGGVGSATYTYDQGNRLIRVVQGSTTIDYTYDVNGQRIAKVVTGGTSLTERFVHDAAGNVLLVVDGTGSVTNRYLHGPRPLEVLLEERTAVAQLAADDPNDSINDEQQLAWLTADLTGNIKDTTDALGVKRRHLRYDPFGAILSTGGAAQPHEPLPRHGYTGHAHERELGGNSGLVFMNARYYDPATGRFISQDPIGFAGGLDNLYGYTGNDVVNRVDPTGEFFLELLIFGLAATGWAGATAVLAHNSDSFADTLTDFGGWAADTLGVESFTLPLGFVNFSFGHGPNGEESFGIGSFIDFTGLGTGLGLNTLITEDAYGNLDTRVGATAGISINGIGLNAGVSPTGDFTGGVSLGHGVSPITAGPSGTFGRGGFSGGFGVNARVPFDFAQFGHGYVPGLDIGRGFAYSDDGGVDQYISAGIGFNRDVNHGVEGAPAHWVSASELPAISATFTDDRGLTGYTLAWDPIAGIERLESGLQGNRLTTDAGPDEYVIGSPEWLLTAPARGLEIPRPILAVADWLGVAPKAWQDRLQVERRVDRYARANNLNHEQAEGMRRRLLSIRARIVEENARVVLFNGTQQDFRSNTVINLLRDVLPETHVLYYDGIGSAPAHGQHLLGRTAGRAAGTAFGAGVKKDVRNAYRRLVDAAASDPLLGPIIIAGYSRGASQATELTSMLNDRGLAAGDRRINRPDNLLLVDLVNRNTVLLPLMPFRLDPGFDKTIHAARATAYYSLERRLFTDGTFLSLDPDDWPWPGPIVLFDNSRLEGTYTVRELHQLNHSTIGRSPLVAEDMLRQLEVTLGP